MIPARIVTAAICAFSLAGAAPAPAPHNTAAPEDAPEIEIVDLQYEQYRRMTVPVTIGTQGPFRFMIDTGAQATVVSRELADRLALTDRRPAILVGMASQRPVETTFIADLMLGSRTVHVRSAPVLEGAHIGGADGILGLDSLQGQRVLLDFDAGTLSVADARELGGNRGYEIVVRAQRKLGQLIITRARIDGVPVAVLVDTGAQSSVGNPALHERLRRARDLGETRLTDVNGVALVGTARIAGELMVGNASVRNFPLMFADSPTFHALGLADEPALVLGMSELRLFRRVAIDFKERRVLFDLPAGARWNAQRTGSRL